MRLVPMLASVGALIDVAGPIHPALYVKEVGQDHVCCGEAPRPWSGRRFGKALTASAEHVLSELPHDPQHQPLLSLGQARHFAYRVPDGLVPQRTRKPPIQRRVRAILEPRRRRKAHRLCYRHHLLVARTVYTALLEVHEVSAGNHPVCRLVGLLARPSAPVRMPVGVLELLEPLRDVNEIYDTKR
jgi:hypothetical protein